MSGQPCRSCGAILTASFVDLGGQPISNAFRTAEQLSSPELFYPLRAMVCSNCKLVQLKDTASREAHFHANYVYFSSFSKSWLNHAQAYATAMIARFHLDATSRVVEIASNDGYLLRNFNERGIPSLGVEPSANVAAAARAQGVETREAFFGAETALEMAAEGLSADLMPSNNVLAHVPDLNDFVAGFRILLKPSGVATFEFPHLLPLIQNVYFDTIYHEHYSYFSLLALLPLLQRQGLEAFDVEKLSTHGGSLRLFVAPAGSNRAAAASLTRLIAEEKAAGLDDLVTYASFKDKTYSAKRAILSLLCDLKMNGHAIAAYGAPAKGNTLLNFIGARTDFIDFTVDRNPNKQGLFLPGTAVPVLPVEALMERKPDYVLILPWNLASEIMDELSALRAAGSRFIIPLPRPIIV
jgi:SAM-dependent methyltransferase